MIYEMYLEIPKGCFYIKGFNEDIFIYRGKEYKLRERSKGVKRFTNQDLMRDFIKEYKIENETKVNFKIEKYYNRYTIWMK